MNVQAGGRSRRSGTAGWRLKGWMAAAVFGAGASGWIAWSGGAKVVHAGEGTSVDSDGDGLHDELELVMGTNPFRYDTDGDGFGDGEEVARGSNPRRKQLVPTGNDAGLSMDAYLENGRVHVLTTIYLPPGDERARKLQFGLERNGRLMTLPLGAMRGGEGPRISLFANGGRLVVLDPVVPEQFVIANGGLAMWATVSSSSHFLAAGSLSVGVVDGQLFQRVVIEANPLVTAMQQTTPAQGGVFRPLLRGGAGSSASQLPGQICAQTTMTLGVVGALVTSEVVDAGCVEGWDAHCTPGCAATIGMTIKSIDTAALIGG